MSILPLIVIAAYLPARLLTCRSVCLSAGMNESSAPCVPIAHETSGDCYPPGKTGGPHTCQSQKWYPTPPPTDPAACSHELAALCPPFQAAVNSGASGARRGPGEGACLACARVAAHWNQLQVVGCADALIASFCNGTSIQQ